MFPEITGDKQDESTPLFIHSIVRHQQQFLLGKKSQIPGHRFGRLASFIPQIHFTLRDFLTTDHLNLGNLPFKGAPRKHLHICFQHYGVNTLGFTGILNFGNDCWGKGLQKIFVKYLREGFTDAYFGGLLGKITICYREGGNFTGFFQKIKENSQSKNFRHYW